MKKTKLFSLLSFLVIIFISSACTTITEVEQSKYDSKNNPENKVNINVDINSCFSDDDCIQAVFCGCHTRDYINTKIEEANKAGIMYYPCTHPPDSYCVCKNNECVQLIDKEARKEKAEQFTINNSQIENIPNLINYNQDEISASELNLGDDFIISWPISLNQYILTDESIDIINLNLPQDINMILERSEYGDNRWRGVVISEDPMFSKNDKVFFSTLNNRFLGTIMPYQIKINDYSYTITSNNIRVK